MASNLSTPESVLNAPQPSVQAQGVPQGATRRERRSGTIVVPPGMGEKFSQAFAQMVGMRRNAPLAYRPDAPPKRRGKKARRRGK